MDEVDVQAVDLGHELRQRVQSRLAHAPVVVARPVAGERLDRRQLHTLGAVADRLRVGPARRSYAASEVLQSRIRDIEEERANDPLRRRTLAPALAGSLTVGAGISGSR